MDVLQYLSVSNVTSRSFLVQWNQPKCSPSKLIKHYFLRIERVENLGHSNCQREEKSFSFTLPANKTSFLFTKGYPYRKYLVIVHVQMSEGIEESASQAVNMLESGETSFKVLFNCA